MPRRDGTGPMGQGAMTGRGAGPCNGVNTGFYGGYGGGGFGRGMRCGGGMGFFNRRRSAGYYPDAYTTKTEKEVLAEEKSWLENRLNAIAQQLNNLPEDNK